MSATTATAEAVEMKGPAGEIRPGDEVRHDGDWKEVASIEPSKSGVTVRITFAGNGGGFAPRAKTAVRFRRRQKDAAAPAAFDDTAGIYAMLRTVDGIGDAIAAKAIDEAGIHGETPATPEQLERLNAKGAKAKPGLRGKARATWIVTGQDGKAQQDRARYERQMRSAGETAARRAAATNGRRPGRRPSGVNVSDEAIAIAHAAKDLGTAAFKTPIGSTQAQRVLDVMKKRIADSDDGTVTDAIGVGERTLRAYAVKGDDPTPQLKAMIKEIAGETGDRLVWGRKLGLILLAIHRAETKTAAAAA